MKMSLNYKKVNIKKKDMKKMIRNFKINKKNIQNNNIKIQIKHIINKGNNLLTILIII